MRLSQKQYWIFDLDGTLTVAQHDFDAIRHAVDLPPGEPILECLERLPPDLGAEKQRQLEAIELEIARGAQAQQGAGDLLAQLHYGDCRIGIVTRNSYENTLVTLQAAGLAEYFDRQTIISRACAQPKPHPDGIHRLLSRWTGHVAHCVMVGDYLFDMQCGREAGVTTVYLDQAGEDLWSDYADLVVRSLEQLQAYL